MRNTQLHRTIIRICFSFSDIKYKMATERDKRRVTMVVLKYIREFAQIPTLAFIKSKFPYLRVVEISNIV